MSLSSLGFPIISISFQRFVESVFLEPAILLLSFTLSARASGLPFVVGTYLDRWHLQCGATRIRSSRINGE